jgi:hypothetical protein
LKRIRAGLSRVGSEGTGRDKEMMNNCQLSEKIAPALPPSQEEAGDKHWWQFWRRG